MPESIANDEARAKYQSLLENVGFDPEVARGITEDVFSAVREAEHEVEAQQ